MADKKPAPLIILISAPSGAGKTTLCDLLLQACPNLARAITCTTRGPRPSEAHGADYYFFTPEEFARRVAAGEFLEHATVYGNCYGLLKSELLDKLHAGKDVLLNVDVQGAATIRAAVQSEPELKSALVTLFLTPPSVEVLEARLKHRNSDDPAVIQKRLASARQEVERWKDFDYLVISTTKSEDLRRTLAIVEAEKMRVERSHPPKMDREKLELAADRKAAG